MHLLQPLNQRQPPAPLAKVEKLAGQIEGHVAWRETNLPNVLSQASRILLSMAKYLSDATMANYVMSSRHKSGLTMLTESTQWRAPPQASVSL